MSRLCCCFPRGVSSEKTNKVTSSNRAEASKLSLSAQRQSPVLVELFTSQGCISCPPADLLISKLGQDGCISEADKKVQVLVLAYHVDYWDYLGWKDPFANSRWSSRQRAYGEVLQQDNIYTPEAVVQGRTHCIAANESSLISLIVGAARYPPLDVRASFSRSPPLDLEVSVTISVKFMLEGKLDAWVAITESGLVTDCTKGENKGKVLTNNFVVRVLEKACSVQSIQVKKPLKARVNFRLWENYSKGNCKLVVFLQNSSSMEIYGSQAVDLPDDC